MSKRWATAATLAVILIMGSVGVAKAGRTGDDRFRVGPPRFTGAGGWQLRSNGWDLQQERYVPSGAGESWTEITLASFGLPAGRSGSHARRLNLTGRGHVFPATGVALQLSPAELPGEAVGDSRFPIELATFRRERSPSDRGQPEQFTRSVIGDGTRLSVVAFIGARASTRSRRRLRELIGSLHFPPAHPGPNANGAQGLGSPGRYRVGTFTLIHQRDQSFYLVHAPGPAQLPPCSPRATCTPQTAFYAVYCDPGANLGPCRVGFDPIHDRFLGVRGRRWNRLGQPIAPAPLSRDNALASQVVTTSFNGQLILPPLTTGATLTRRLWPRWDGR